MTGWSKSEGTEFPWSEQEQGNLKPWCHCCLVSVVLTFEDRCIRIVASDKPTTQTYHSVSLRLGVSWLADRSPRVGIKQEGKLKPWFYCLVYVVLLTKYKDHCICIIASLHLTNQPHRSSSNTQFHSSCLVGQQQKPPTNLFIACV